MTDTELKVMAALAMTTQEKSEEGIERCRATMQQAPLQALVYSNRARISAGIL